MAKKSKCWVVDWWVNKKQGSWSKHVLLVAIVTGIISSVIVLLAQYYVFSPLPHITITDSQQTYNFSYFDPIAKYNQSSPPPQNKTYVDIYVSNQGGAPCGAFIFNVTTLKNSYINGNPPNITVYPSSVQVTHAIGSGFQNDTFGEEFTVSIYNMPALGYAYIYFTDDQSQANANDLYANISVIHTCDSHYTEITTSSLNNKFYSGINVTH